MTQNQGFQYPFINKLIKRLNNLKKFDLFQTKACFTEYVEVEMALFCYICECQDNEYSQKNVFRQEARMDVEIILKLINM